MQWYHCNIIIPCRTQIPHASTKQQLVTSNVFDQHFNKGKMFSPSIIVTWMKVIRPDQATDNRCSTLKVSVTGQRQRGK